MHQDRTGRKYRFVYLYGSKYDQVKFNQRTKGVRQPGVMDGALRNI